MTQETNQSPDAGPAERFVALARGSSLWKSVDLRICAIRSGRRWVNLVTRGFLDHRAPRSVTKFLRSSGQMSVLGRSFVPSRICPLWCVESPME